MFSTNPTFSSTGWQTHFARQKNTAGVKYPNRLRYWRKKRGLKLHELAALYEKFAPEDEGAYSLQHISNIEKGGKKLYMHVAEAFAKALGVDTSQLLPADQLHVNIVGRIGAGAVVIPFDDFPQGGGLDTVRCPPGLDPTKTVAVEVSGDSMAPLIEDGWLVFYSRDPEPDESKIIGRTCVVKLTNGQMLLKQVRRAPTTGRFNLISVNAQMIENAELEWAAPVSAIVSPDVAEAETTPAPVYSPVENKENRTDDLHTLVSRLVNEELEKRGVALNDRTKERMKAELYGTVKAGEQRARRKQNSPSAPRASNKATNPKHKGLKPI